MHQNYFKFVVIIDSKYWQLYSRFVISLDLNGFHSRFGASNDPNRVFFYLKISCERFDHSLVRFATNRRRFDPHNKSIFDWCDLGLTGFGNDFDINYFHIEWGIGLNLFNLYVDWRFEI
jgi:hypothetical protein